MEEKYFANGAPKKDSKIGDKNATTDFLNNETGRNNVTIDIPTPDPVQSGTSTNDSGSTAKTQHHEQRNRKASDSGAVIVDSIDNSSKYLL